MTGAIDNVLSGEEFLYFDQHVEDCESCRDEFELERLTKTYFRDRVKLIDPPTDLLDSIKARLAEEDRTRPRELRSPGLSFRRYLWPALGTAAAMAVMILVLIVMKSGRSALQAPQQVSTTPVQQFPQTGDALELSENDLQMLLSGQFSPQIKTRDVNSVDEFVKREAGFSIPLPEIRDADWIGGSVAALKDGKVAHIAYKVGGSYLVIYAFPSLLAHSQTISLSLGCIRALDENRWFWNQSSTGNLQAVWKYKNRVCVASSNIDKHDLIAYLKTIKGVGDEGWE